MMEGLRTWLLSLMFAAVLCAMARALMPAGPVKRAGNLICGLVMLTAVLAPAARLSPGAAEAWMAQLSAGQTQREEELRRSLNEGMKRIIEQEFAAYIVDKAAEFGLDCTAQVTCEAAEDGLCLPVRAEVTGPLSQTDQDRLTQLLQEELGIPAEGQVYHIEKELP